MISGTCNIGRRCGGTGGRTDFNIEVGALTVIDIPTRSPISPASIPTQVFDSPPFGLYLANHRWRHAAAHRIRNVTSEGFDIMTLEPDGEDGPATGDVNNYLARSNLRTTAWCRSLSLPP